MTDNTPTEFDIRVMALEYALRTYPADAKMSTDRIIEESRKIEQFLSAKLD